MPSVDTTYQTFKTAVAALTGDGPLPSRVQRAQDALAMLASHVEAGAVFDAPALQARFERLLGDHRSDAATRANEILLLFEEVSAVYHVWMSQAGRSC